MFKAEILSIGTELLLGEILNTNAQFIATELADIAIGCYFQTTVGDNKARIKDCLTAALNRADIVITTGGLGPTVDDLTIECIAELFDTPLQFDEKTLRKIEHIFTVRGLAMPESNRKQALRPQGADILPNPYGTAPGIIWQLSPELLRKAGVGDAERMRVILTFPGVPAEMKAMWKETAHAFLSDKFGEGTIWSCELKHYGIGESAMAEMHADLLDLENPTVAPYAGTGECRLRVTAKAESVEAAKKLAEPIVKRIREKSGMLCYGLNEDTLESVVGSLLTERNLTVAVAESCTGGLVSKRLTDIPHSSNYTLLNVVTYANEAKQKVLGVHDYILNTKGAVSAECAHAMATGVRKLAGADIGVAVTGIAGPDGGTVEKPVGLVYLALVADHFQADKKLTFSDKLSRNEIRIRSASEALNMVRMYLLDPESLQSV